MVDRYTSSLGSSIRDRIGFFFANFQSTIQHYKLIQLNVLVVVETISDNGSIKDMK